MTTAVLVLGGGCTVRIADEEFQLPGKESVFAEATGLAHAPRDARAQIASGAGGRFALAGAKCERRLPARYGPAPEVPVEQHGSGTRGVPNGSGRRRVFPSHEGGSDVLTDHVESTEGYR